jgi:F420-0:gamma-glutamyl ligase
MALGRMVHELKAELAADKYNVGRGYLKLEIADYTALQAKLKSELREQVKKVAIIIDDPYRKKEGAAK